MHVVQARFRPARSCADIIFLIRRIIEDYREFQASTAEEGDDEENDLHMLFVDFSKAFDSVPREKL